MSHPPEEFRPGEPNKKCITVEIIGYVGRALSAKEDPGYWTIGPYVIQAILILVAPALLAATIYMQLGRIIVVTDGESLSLIRKKWLTKTFVFGDVSSFLLQGGGTVHHSLSLRIILIQNTPATSGTFVVISRWLWLTIS